MKQQKMFYQLLHADVFRGWDATGVITVAKNGDFGIMKEASDAYVFNGQFIDSDLDKDMFKEGVAMIGHNRAKTIGENKDINAHPFVVDQTFAMVHNGTLRNHKDMHDTEVDSEALAKTFKNAMDQEDWKTAMEEALGKVQGAFAVVWYDQKRDQVCMMRNNERPLALIKLNTAYLFASEGPMAQWIAMRNDEKVVDAKMLVPNTLYTFDMKKSGGDVSETFLSPKLPKVKASHGRGFRNGTGTDSVASPTASLTPSEEANINALFQEKHGKEDKSYLSKNAFKRLRAKVIGKRISFWVDDYVDTVNDNQGRCLEALVLGSNIDGAYDICEYSHVVRAAINMKEQGLQEADFYGYVEMEGRVADMTYDVERKMATIWTDTVKIQTVDGKYATH
jgi:hypothetical protein